MQLKIFNTLTKKIEPVYSHGDGKIGIYSCGITAYDYAHLGNLRKYVMDDVLVRTLRYDGYKVKFVQNVTDVGHMTSDADEGEDKLEKGSKKYKKSVFEIARKFEQYFYDVSAEVGNLKPDVITRASEYIGQQLKIAIELEKKGYAYLIPEEGLYFDTSKMANYGQLADLKVETLKEGARVEIVKGKKNPADFALWKLEKPGENRQMSWPCPWGERSFPGWHLECVAMSIEQLGEQFEIHTGGIDHIPVHHTNEIAQAEAYTGKSPFVRTWVHHNFMRVEGKKMSKSLGNVYKLEDVKEKGFSPMALRYLFLTAHYRKELNFTWESLAAAQTAYDRLLNSLVHFSQEKEDSMVLEDNIERARKFSEEFLQAVNDDLNFPQALAILQQMLKSTLGKGERYNLAIEWDNLLGLDLRRQTEKLKQKAALIEKLEVDGEAKLLMVEREIAKANKDYARADFLRERIMTLGYELEDAKSGTKLKKIHEKNQSSS